MSTSEPLRTNEDIQKIKTYFLENNRIRDYVLFTLGINTALRISDLLNLTWNCVFDFKTGVFLDHISINEQKTKKKRLLC